MLVPLLPATPRREPSPSGNRPSSSVADGLRLANVRWRQTLVLTGDSTSFVEARHQSSEGLSMQDSVFIGNLKMYNERTVSIFPTEFLMIHICSCLEKGQSILHDRLVGDFIMTIKNKKTAIKNLS